MKKFLFAMFILISLATNSQQLIRGYSASFAYGLLSTGDDFTIHYENADYTATARGTEGVSLSFGFPFDYGVYRHRLVLLPGIDLQSASYSLDLDPDIPSIGADSDSLKLHSFMIIPQIGIMYKYHFYIGPLHLALGLGVDIKYPVSNEITIVTKDKTDIITPNADSESGDDIIFKPNTVYSNLADLGLHFSPKVEIDIFATRFLVTNIFYYTSPLTSFTDTPKIRGFVGVGATYLVPFGKEDESRLLQYYKN
jgi:hypothetical protein